MDQINSRGALWGSLSLVLVVSGCGTPVNRALVRLRTEQLFAPSQSASLTTTSPQQSSQLPEQPTLQDYIRIGLLRNPDLRGDYERWRAALEKIPQVTSLPDPMFSYGHFIEEIQTRTGPQENRFGLSQTFPWFGKLSLRGEVASRQAESLWWQVQGTRLRLVRNIKNAYYEYAYLAQAIRITDANLQLLKRLEPVAQRKVAAGASQEGLLRLQVEIGKVENGLETLRKLRPAISARLSAAIDRREREALPWPEELKPQVGELSVETLHQTMVARNPMLESLRQQILSAQSRKELADLDGWPDITLGADYLETGSAVMPGVRGSGNDPYGFRVMFNVPIWRDKYSAAARQAERQEASAMAKLRDRHNQLRSDLELAYYKLDDAARQIRLYRDTLLPRAQQSFEITEEAYRAGKSTLFDLIDTEQVLLAFQKSVWRAISNHEQSLAEIEVLCGGEIR